MGVYVLREKLINEYHLRVKMKNESFPNTLNTLKMGKLFKIVLRLGGS